MAQIDAQAPELGILARLSSTVTVEDSKFGLQVWRETEHSLVGITLHQRAEEALLALLLARRDARVAP